VEEEINRARSRPPLDAAIGQVEASAGEIENRKVGFLPTRLQMAGSKSPSPSREAGREVDVAVGAGDRFAQHLVVARNQSDRHLGLWRSCGKRARKDMEAVAAHQRRQTDVGDDEPLGGLRLPALSGRFL